MQKLGSQKLTIYESKKCPICFSDWNEKDIHKIRLTCGHLLCVSCLPNINTCGLGREKIILDKCYLLD
jgi:hypothetical protein